MVDDMGYADIGCYGATEIETPQIDKIADQGLRMRNFSNTAKCHSSRVSLLSGLWCNQAGSSSLKHAVTFPEVLQKSGYQTGMTGKWHLVKNPLDWGFDRYFGHLSGSTDYVGGDKTFRDGREVFDTFGKNTGEFYTTDAMTDYAIKYINEWEKEDDKPFALYIAYNAPHSPLQAPKELIEKYRGRFMDGWKANQKRRFQKQKKLGVISNNAKLPEWPGHHRNWNEISDMDKSWEDYRRAIYAAMVESLDMNIGRLKAELVAKGEWDNTLFLFFSDNGSDSREINRNPYGNPWEAKYHVQVGAEWAGVGNTPFRWYKQNQHEGGISTPMIISWPKGIKAKGWNNFRGHIVDIYPTLLDLSRTEYPLEYNGKTTIPLEGESLVSVFTNNEYQRTKPIYLKYAENKGVINGNMKLVSARKGPWELYNLDEDPTELNDLASEKPVTTEQLRKLFVSMLIKDRYSEDKAKVNDFIAPWGTRSYDNKNLKEGDPNPAENHPTWKQEPAIGL
jgi:arylsulfatase